MPRRRDNKVGEKLQELQTKFVYYYFDEIRGIKIKSREVYKNGKKVVHHPFRQNGTWKYDKIAKITYLELPENLPRGFLKDWKTGYGFSRVYSPLLYALEREFEINEVVLGKNLVFKVENGKLFLNASHLDRIYPKIDTLLKRHGNETSKLATDILSGFFPSKFKKDTKKYTKNTLHEFIESNVTDGEELSEKDTRALFELASKVSKQNFLESKISILKTKEKIDEVYIKEVIERFDRLLQRKNNTKNLEEEWQEFFSNYSWIFSQLFSFPVLILENKAYAGGKSIDNANGKIADFIYKNKLTNNIAFIEIKTHKTEILSGKPYRGNDVFSSSKDLSGAINQVLDQRDNLQKEFYALKGKSKDKEFESYNSKCVVVIGMIQYLSDEEKKSFELTRGNSKDVEIVTFDEVFEKIKGLQKLLFGNKEK